MNITNLGIGSGLDLEGIITASINAESIPQEIRLQEKEDRLNVELSGVGSFRSSLDTFNTTLKKLTEEDAFNKQVVSSSNAGISVKSNGFASNGEFEISVSSLAKGTKYHTDSVASSSTTLGSGKLTFGSGSDSFTVDIAEDDDLSTIRDKINAESDNFGVTANIINTDTGSFLVYNSSITGKANELSVTSTGSATLDKLTSTNANATKVQSAQDATITLDGVTISSDTNEFKNVVEDLTINVSSLVDANDPGKISVAQDTENGSELLNEFISGFNTLMSDLTGLGAPRLGRLAFDPNVRQVRQQLSEIAIQAVKGVSGDIKGLTDVGIDLNKDGQLQISTLSADTIRSGQERMDEALENNLDEVGKLFASENGVASAMSKVIDNYIGGDGVLTKRSADLNERLSDIPDEYQQLEDRLRSIESRLRSEFTFLDSTIAQFNATSDYLTSTLANLTPSRE